jgi:hypothetical protein
MLKKSKPKTYFNRKNILYLSLGSVFLMTFLDWLTRAAGLSNIANTAEQDESNITDVINSTQVVTTLLTPLIYGINQYNASENQVDTLHSKIQQLIVVAPGVDPDTAKKDIAVLHKTLMDLYPKEKCKIDALFNMTGFNFQIVPDNLYTGLNVSSAYDPTKKQIRLRQGLHQVNPQLLSQECSHNMRYATDAYDNYRQNRCVNKKDQSACTMIFGFFPKDERHIPVTPQEIGDFMEVRNLIRLDTVRINDLYTAINKPLTTRTLKEIMQLDKLKNRIHDEKYKHVFDSVSYPEVDKFVLLKEKYHYDSALDKYVGIDKKDLLKLLTAGVTLYIHEFKLKKNEVSMVVSYTDTTDFSNENLAKDLLSNLKTRIDKVEGKLPLSKDYTVFEQLSEIGAIVDEVLNPYEILRLWLFPNLIQHQEERAAPERKECLRM